jgi:penicillin-binding protein 2
MTVDSGPPDDIPKSRIRFLEALVLLISVMFAFRLFFLQVVKGKDFRRKAQSVAQRVTSIPSQRGEIYDRNNNVPLVINSDSFAVDVIPASIPSDRRETVMRKLSVFLDIPLEELESRVPRSYYHLYQPIEVKDNLPFEEIVHIAELQDEFPGVTWHEKPMRNYLETGSISHILGYVGDITREELQIRYNQGYKTGDIIGKLGVESQYDELLRGKDGREYKTVDVKGKRIVDALSRVEKPEPGKNLVLTIDRTIQTLAEKALGERVGSVIVLKPSTGEVLAMVSYPWYSPNLFQTEQGSKEFKRLIEDPNTPLLNRSIQSRYPPASTFKIVMDAAVREEDAYDPALKIDCLGEITYGDRLFRCHIRKPGHGWLDLRGGLTQSCDVYFWTIAKDYLGIERIVEYAKEFAITTPTGIDLPGEVAGFIPTPQWKERRFHEKWLGGDTLNTAIGQGFTLVTPIQVANMVSEVVNAGDVYKPHVLKEVRDPISGALIRSVDRELLYSSRISKETFTELRADMRSVVQHGTTSSFLDLKSVQVAGKTGTGEVGSTDHWHSWFAAFAPYDFKSPDEAIVVCVLVEAVNPWEWWAPFATAIIYQGIFANMTYEEAVVKLGLSGRTAPARERIE